MIPITNFTFSGFFGGILVGIISFFGICILNMLDSIIILGKNEDKLSDRERTKLYAELNYYANKDNTL